MWSTLVLVLATFGSRCFATNYPKDTCGRRPLIAPNNDIDKIVGGTVAVVGDWPWQISMLLNGRHICGGSLINDEWVITAAHCVVGNTNPAAYRILLGAHDRTNLESWVLSRNVKRIVYHPKYDSRLIRDDIAVMQLSAKVEPFTEYYMPVCFPASSQSFEDETGFTTGWGAQFYGGTVTRYLMQVATRIVTDNECNEFFGRNLTDTKTQVCSGGDAKGACQGDSGGPLVVADQSDGSKYTLVGLTSWGIDCGKGGVYTRVSAYLPWIESTIGSKLTK